MEENWSKKRVNSCDARFQVADNVRRRLDNLMAIPGIFTVLVVSEGVGHWTATTPTWRSSLIILLFALNT